MAITGWNKAVKTHKRRLILDVSGLEKNGKTTFALSGPAPIAVFDIDRGLEGVVDKFCETKEILIKDYRSMPYTNQAQYEAVYKMMEKDYYDVINEPKIRTVVMDTGSEWWEKMRLAYFGKLTQIKPVHYVEVNSAFRKLVDAAYEGDKNLIIISRLKKEFKDDKFTGEYERAGFSELGFLVQANLRAFRPVKKVGREREYGEFSVQVIDCRQNAQIAGDIFEGDMATFPMIAINIVPDSDLGDWE